MPAHASVVRNHSMDSTPWRKLEYRNDDVVIASWGKSGTTWLQQIVGQLIFRGDAKVDITALSPWLESLWPPAETKLRVLSGQSHRRFIKTHLPPAAICFSDRARYIYVARNGIDVAFSLYRHLRAVDNDGYRFLELLGAKQDCGERLERPGGGFREFWAGWLHGNGYPMWPFWDNVRAWWNVRERPNVLLIHFDQLKSDLSRTIVEIADFLSISVDRELVSTLEMHCSLAWMKQHAELSAPFELKAYADRSGRSFFNRGVHGQWRDELTEADIRAYYEISATQLGAGCANWLNTGKPATRRLETGITLPGEEPSQKAGRTTD